MGKAGPGSAWRCIARGQEATDTSCHQGNCNYMLGKEKLHHEGGHTEMGPGAVVESLLLEMFRIQPGRALSNQLHVGPVAKSESEDSSDDEPLIKKLKKPPTDEELKETVKNLLANANLEEVTMKQICKEVYENYPSYDLSDRKDFIKKTVKEFIHMDLDLQEKWADGNLIKVNKSKSSILLLGWNNPVQQCGRGQWFLSEQLC
ncbi:hypothetical protein QYF61_011711 [Mycteria americana]|uniref:Protein DEK n=1 Tax=Mycteria americana TaxID=33587 RepID=A0AAN7NFS7_MYCAM|nr:hypothetical protein QYF61_011711 [Mycteria americana]